MTICYCAIARRDDKGFRIKAAYTNDKEESKNELSFGDITNNLLKNYPRRRYSIAKQIEKDLRFYAHETNGWANIVITTPKYPEAIANECLAELSISNQWYVGRNKESRQIKRDHFCRLTALKFSDTSEGGILWHMNNEITDKEIAELYTLQNSRAEERQKRKDQLNNHIETLKRKMVDNIGETLKRTPDLDELSFLADDTVEKAKVFKKKSLEAKEETEVDAKVAQVSSAKALKACKEHVGTVIQNNAPNNIVLGAILPHLTQNNNNNNNSNHTFDEDSSSSKNDNDNAAISKKKQKTTTTTRRWRDNDNNSNMDILDDNISYSVANSSSHHHAENWSCFHDFLPTSCTGTNPFMDVMCPFIVLTNGES